MSVLKEAWDALRTVASVVETVDHLAVDVRALHEKNRDLLQRVTRLETIIELASARRLPRPE
jgi:hypothetical protein